MAFSVDLLSSRDLHNLKNHENRCTVVQNRRSTKRHQAYDPEVLDLDFAYFGVPMGDVFGYFLNTVSASIFTWSPGLCQKSKTLGRGR